LKSAKSFHDRLRCFAAGLWRVLGRFDQLHGRDVTWTVRKNCGDADDELCADSLDEQWITVAHCRLAIDAQVLRFAVHGDEEHSDAGVDENVS
jgi:hypothetical protein